MSDDVARLLAHPLRQRLLFEYDEPTSPSKAARRLRQPVNVVSYHTDVLLRRGWIELVRTERRRGAVEHFYRSTGPRVIEDADWAKLPLRLRHAIVVGTVSGTADEARAAALEGGFDEATSHLSRSLLELDEQGVAEVAEALRRTIDEIAAIAASARERRTTARERREVVIQFFRAPPAR
jgi:DNA-binding transcriptional ArsR family regulator